MNRRQLRYCKHGIRNDQNCPDCYTIQFGRCPHGVELNSPDFCQPCHDARENAAARRIAKRMNPMPEREVAEAPESFPVDHDLAGKALIATNYCRHGIKYEEPCTKCNRHLLELGPTLAVVMAKLESLEKKFDEIAARQFADPTPDQEFLTVKQAAAYLNVSESSVRRMKHLHVKRGKSIRLRRSTLDRTFRSDPLKAA